MSSSTKELLGLFSTLKQTTRMELDVWFVDTDTYGPKTFGISDKIPPKLEFVGGGGTDLQSAFDKIKDLHLTDKYDGVVVLTDGYTYPSHVKDTINKPTLWVFVNTRWGGCDTKCATFGEKIEVSV